MSQWVVALLLSAIAAWLGYRSARFSARALLPVPGLAASWWIARYGLLILAPTDVSLSEDYVNGLDLPQLAVELAVASVWLCLCLIAGAGIKRILRGRIASGRQS